MLDNSLSTAQLNRTLATCATVHPLNAHLPAPSTHQAWFQAFRVENPLPTLPATLSSQSPSLSLPATTLHPTPTKALSTVSTWQPRATILVGKAGHTAPLPFRGLPGPGQSSPSPFHHLL